MSRDETVQIGGSGVRSARASSRARWTRRGLLALCVVALLAFTLHSLRLSDASFTAASSNGSNVFVSGTLGHVNDQNGLVMINVTGMDPGESITRRMTLTGTGTLPGDYALTPQSLVDTGTAALSGALNLTIEDVTSGPAAILFDGSVDELDPDVPVELGSIAPSTSRSYDVTIDYPDGPNVAALQGTRMTLVMKITEVSQ